MTPLVKNILIVTALTGAGIFVYNKWFKTDAAEKKSGVDGGCGCGCSGGTENSANYIGDGGGGSKVKVKVKTK